MGLFQGKKLKVEKAFKNESNQYYIDYDKLKNNQEFLTVLYKKLVGEHSCLFLIDSAMFYEKGEDKVQKLIQKVRDELKGKGIDFKELILKKEADNRVLGIKITAGEKVNHYQLGVPVQADQISDMVEVIANYNAFCYVWKNNSSEEMIDAFTQARGEFEELRELCEYYSYQDSYFKRISITSKQDISEVVDLAVMEYEKK